MPYTNDTKVGLGLPEGGLNTLVDLSSRGSKGTAP